MAYDDSEAHGQGVDWDAEPDLELLRKAADGMMSGSQQAFRDLCRLAERGSLQSVMLIGYAYGQGFGVAKNPEKQISWYRVASEAGSVDASYRLGRIFTAAGNAPEAVEFYKRAISKNYTPAMYQLAMIYLRGALGVETNKSKARELLEVASSLGHVHARRELGLALALGRYGILNIARGVLTWLTVLPAATALVAKDPRSDNLRYR